MAKARMIWTDTPEGVITAKLGKDGLVLFSGNLNDLSEPMKLEAIKYGIKQKLSDSLARPKDETLTDDEKAVELATNWQRISVNAEWNAKPKKLSPYERAVRALKAYEKEVEGLCDQLKEKGATEELIESMLETVWQPKLDELQANVTKLA